MEKEQLINAVKKQGEKIEALETAINAVTAENKALKEALTKKEDKKKEIGGWEEW